MMKQATALGPACSTGDDMRYALTAEQMRAVEDRAVAEGVATLGELMCRAGEALADEVLSSAPDGPVAVVCGPGNNGGDGWVAAHRLHEASRECVVLCLRAPGELSGAARSAAEAAVESGIRWELAGGPADALVSNAAVVVDAVFGFGFKGAPEGVSALVLDAIATSGAFVVSADVPSGVNADTGAVAGPAVRADVTVTFTALKPGLLLYPGAEHAGRASVAEIGIPVGWTDVPGALEVPDATDLRAAFPWPGPQDHKGSRGRVAILAGSTTYPGAAVLAARGALRMGPGFTVVVVPEPVADIVRAAAPNALVRAVPAGPDGTVSSVTACVEAVSDADAVVAGPGLTTGGVVSELVGRLIAEAPAPLVLDADALNALPSGMESLGEREAPLIVTPHPGEAARILGVPTPSIQSDRVTAAVSMCGPQAVCLLKGARTIVASSTRRAVVVAGNAGLARAGSGDVLSGMLGALLAHRVPAFDAAVLGAFLHGRAAEHGTRRLTVTCFTSADITDHLPDAVRDVTGE